MTAITAAQLPKRPPLLFLRAAPFPFHASAFSNPFYPLKPPSSSYSNEPLLLSRPPPPSPPATDEATLPPGHHAHAMVNQIGRGALAPHASQPKTSDDLQISPPPFVCSSVCLPLSLPWDFSCQIWFPKTWRLSATRLPPPQCAAAAAAATRFTAHAFPPIRSTPTSAATCMCRPPSLHTPSTIS